MSRKHKNTANLTTKQCMKTSDIFLKNKKMLIRVKFWVRSPLMGAKIVIKR